MDIRVGARDSPLSKAQINEVLEALQQGYPEVTFTLILKKTTGDHDQLTSLRFMDKTNFFTKEIDEMQLRGECRITIHSAKDLPDPIPTGLKLVALTKGQDPSDSIVFREGDTLDSLLRGAIVGSSSTRRDHIVHALRSDLQCKEVRGTIEKRLQKLYDREFDALIVAEAALIRLNLTHLNRSIIPGKTAPLQGQLAILAHTQDKEMEVLFSVLDVR